jgi:hypothetical protein
VDAAASTAACRLAGGWLMPQCSSPNADVL